jgi:hypothetical protein
MHVFVYVEVSENKRRGGSGFLSFFFAFVLPPPCSHMDGARKHRSTARASHNLVKAIAQSDIVPQE